MGKEYFFAYGTLQPSSNLKYFEENELSKYLIPLGKAQVKGVIVHLRNLKLSIDYPGMILTDEAANHVEGTLFEVHEPEVTYKIMDAHELFTTEPSSSTLIPIDLFEKKEVIVERQNLPPVRASTYAFNPSSKFLASGAVVKVGAVESGDWLGYIKKEQSL